VSCAFDKKLLLSGNNALGGDGLPNGHMGPRELSTPVCERYVHLHDFPADRSQLLVGSSS